MLLCCSEVSMPESGVMQLCNALAECERYTPGDVPGSRQLVVPVIQGMQQHRSSRRKVTGCSLPDSVAVYEESAP